MAQLICMSQWRTFDSKAKSSLFHQTLNKLYSAVPENIHTSPLKDKINGNSKGEGVAKAKVFKEKNGGKLEIFPKGWGMQTKTTFLGGEGYFPWG